MAESMLNYYGELVEQGKIKMGTREIAKPKASLPPEDTSKIISPTTGLPKYRKDHPGVENLRNSMPEKSTFDSRLETVITDQDDLVLQAQASIDERLMAGSAMRSRSPLRMNHDIDEITDEESKQPTNLEIPPLFEIEKEMNTQPPEALIDIEHHLLTTSIESIPSTPSKHLGGLGSRNSPNQSMTLVAEKVQMKPPPMTKAD